jgi:cytochrome c biogenesis protein CcmG, thiol:disulfide interchange protein DsbE
MTDTDTTSDELPAETATSPWPARIGVAIVGLVLLGLVVVLVRSVGDDETRVASPLLDQVAPEVISPTLDGGEYDLDDRRGQWVVVNFFASWCVPCRNEHPELMAFAEAHEPIGDASVVSVLINDDPSDAAAFFAEHGGDWPVLTDPEGQTVVDFGVTAPPETYLVAPSGVVAAAWIGEVTQEQLDGVIAELSGAPPAEDGDEGG